MKKRIIFLSFLFLAVCSMQAQQKQGVKFEGGLALPVGDNFVETTFGLGADISYLFNVVESFQMGPSAGFYNYFGKGSTLPPAMGGGTASDVQLAPLAVSSRYYVIKELFVGVDLGYGLRLDKDFEDESGFYYKPKIGFSFGPISTILSYSSVTGELDDFSAIHLGFEVAF
ncbi:hypothetical protein [Planktosalinus lacus]|uniref:Outer membrane protein beta-barrel domain-containing protein n=1 Tax=Planktosalinus lacus TaxID=1526573 RepID=A0A8J2V9M0_9FLAO|nr:hypothetical protein [Planktosalinus lacus]GGD92226.1 hypothetical protein GCM10011312_15020 [Planktosalinus lacus]